MQNGLDYTSLILGEMAGGAAKDGEILRPAMTAIAVVGMKIPQKTFDMYVEAYSMRSKKDYDGAIQLLRGLPDDIHAKAFLWEIYRESGQATSYKEELEEICKQHENNVYLMSSLALIREEVGDIEGAIEVEGSLVQKTENETEPIKRIPLIVGYYNLACCHYKKEEKNENPDFSSVYKHLEAAVAERDRCDFLLDGYPGITLEKDIKKGYFARLKDEKRFQELAQKLDHDMRPSYRHISFLYRIFRSLKNPLIKMGAEQGK